MILNEKRQPVLLVFVFAMVCVVSALALVYTKHESRKLFVECGRLAGISGRSGVETDSKNLR